MEQTILTTASLTRHCNELLILSVLADAKKHGYQIAQEIESGSDGLFYFNHGTLYPILHKLEKSGYIKGSWTHEGPKRRRKYYTLTAQGRKLMDILKKDWARFFDMFFTITGERE